MSDLSPNLSLPYLLPSQAQKHVTHNEALRQLDALAQLTLQAIDANAPPATPQDGEVHALGSAPTGAWAGQAGRLAVFSDAAWLFVEPQDGWRAWDMGAGALRVYSGGMWLPVAPELQNLPGVGIGASSDATNRLSVASDAALFTHAGSDHRLTINKASSTDTASMVFQSGFSGRAEMGLAGSEDFNIRVSADGSSFTDAVSARRSDGAVRVPCLYSGMVDIADDTVGSITTPSAGGMIVLNIVDPNFPQAAHSGIFSYDTGGSLLLQTMASGTRMDNLGDTALTGTSGAADRSSLAVATGALLLENRTGSTRRYAYSFLNTY
ncbi:DUF2793 domain-containing protein [Primorskyibacter sp. S187A]|uniref:DUF2793 domain-containing protein n=1 Tax=Primorskyibacter sp. S187A TaxID=3415130 RepID=UPI003C7A9E16